MQDPSSTFYPQIKSQAQNIPTDPQFPEHHQHLKCPRCDSTNTKFCYYNNYNLSQPRHYCKSCRRYWTKGGVLRNVPVGGGSRKSTKRSSRDSGEGGEAAEPSAKRQASAAAGAADGSNNELSEAEAPSSSVLKKGEGEANGAADFGGLMDVGLSPLLGSPSGGHFGNYADGLGCFAEDPLILENDGAEFLNVGGGAGGGGDERWSGNSNGWSGIAMYTPDSIFHQHH